MTGAQIAEIQPNEMSGSHAPTMKQLSRWLIGILWALAFVPVNAFAFALTADRTTIFVGESVKLTFSGSASDLTLFTVGVTPDFNYFGEASAVLTNVAATSAALGPLAFTEVNPDPALGAPLLLVMTSEYDLDGCLADPALCLPVPFAVVDGDILTVDLTALNPPSLPVPAVTTVLFDVCMSLDCFPGPAGAGPSTRFTIDITILPRDGTPVPEPATMWLALAALIAGGAVFRNGSKRS